MKGKSIMKVVVFVSLFVFIISIGIAYAKEDKPITLRYTAHAPPKGTRPKAVMWWAEQIEKRSEGLVKMKFFWSDALLKAGDCLEGVGRGTADLGATWGIYHPAKNPLWTVGDPPFSHADPYAALKAMQELYKTYDPMIKELEAWNVKFLAPFVTDMSQVGGSKKAVLVPDDVNGRKVRYAGGEWAKLWKACGAVPLKLTYGEVYEALMRGAADATQCYLWTLESYKLWDVIKHFTLLNAGEICSYGITINMDVWKSFSPKIKKIFLEASDAYVEKYGRDLIESRARVTKLAEQKGVTFYELSSEQLKSWKRKAAPFMEGWVKKVEAKGLPGKATQDRFLSITKKWEREIAEKGYPWTR
jgi:TRAP-type C4-dicarboxylate transport system substrate-binding protein